MPIVVGALAFAFKDCFVQNSDLRVAKDREGVLVIHEDKLVAV